MIADVNAYNFFVKENADLNSAKDEFDSVHGMMVYNRTKQEKGKAVTYLPPDEWIAAVGGSRMYPKISKRKTADGKPIYTYVCKLKERSKRMLCNSKNANGNTLDMAVIEQIKLLEDDKGSFIDQLEQSRKFYTGNREAYNDQLASIQEEKAEVERKIDGLVDSIAELGDSAAKNRVAKRIEQLNQKSVDLDSRIHELECLTSQHALSDIEFDVMRQLLSRQLLSVFKTSIDEMSIEQKRAAIRTLVRKVVWDGVNAHIILFGVQDDEIEYPPLSYQANEANSTEDDLEELERFSDVDYEDEIIDGSKTHWGEDSKRNPHAPACQKEICKRNLPVRTHRNRPGGE